MFKHLVALIVLAIIVIFTMPYLHDLLQLLLKAHAWIANNLKDVFSQGTAGSLLHDLIASLAIPLMAGLIPAIIYGMARRHWFPYFMSIVWTVWLIQTAALVMQYTIPSH